MAYHRDSTVLASATIAQFLQNEARRSSTKRSHKQLTPNRLTSLYTRFVRRQVTLAWKRVTVATRKQERASVIPDGFVLINQHRRSMIMA